MRNKYFKINPLFEVKSMGFSFYVPLILYGYLVYNLFTFNGFEAPIYRLLEFLCVPIAGWWIIYLFYDYYEEGLDQLLHSYPLSHWQRGFVRVNFFLLIHLLIIVFILIVISIKLDTELFPLLLQYIPETLFFAYASLLLIVISKNVSVTLMILGGYIATEIITKGQVIPWYHVMYFNTSALTINEIIDKAIVNLFVSIFTLIIAQLILRYRIR